MLATKDIYMKACMQCKELHALSDDERCRLQAHLRMIYKEIEQVCERHGLRMCAGYGTVLGALRHQGFIPWDDDLDLLMPREDYDLLVNKYAAELPNNLKIYAPNSVNGPIARFAKVVDTNTRFIGPGSQDEESHGIFVDIFPLEGASSRKLHITIKHKISCMLMLIAASVAQHENSKIDDLYKRLMCTTPKGARVYRIRNFIGVLFGLICSKKWFDFIDAYTRCNGVKDGYTVPVGGANKKYFYPVPEEVYFPAKKMTFDDIDIYVPNNSEYHCESEYGNWRCVPPVEDRWQHFIKEIRF